MTTQYRDRLYGAYVSSNEGESAVGTSVDLSPRRPYLADMIRKHFPKDKAARIIDLGCGPGQVLQVAQELGYTGLEGLDVSAEQVARAHAAGLSFVRQGDLMPSLQSMPEGSYEVVVSYDVLEHFTKDELMAFIDEVRRILKPGGRWIIHVPNGNSPFAGMIRYGDFTHELAFTPRSLQQLMKATGFSSVECYEDAPIPRHLRSAVRWAAWKAMRVAFRAWIAVETGVSNPGVLSQNFLAVITK
jgi:SAM-dependent methyltransferase